MMSVRIVLLTPTIKYLAKKHQNYPFWN